MQRRVLAVSLLAVTLAAAAADVAAQGRNRDGSRRRSRVDPASIELENFTWQEQRFDSEAIDGTAEYGIYLPKGYDDPANAETRYPLVIWLHGMFEDHRRFHVRGGAAVLDKAAGDGTLPPCVFVCANGGRTSMYVNRKDQRWQDLITADLLTHLTGTYRVADAREQRAIMGVSMGGMAALRIALSRPELFCAVGAHSSAVFPEDPDDLPDRLKQYASRLGLDEVFGDPIQQEPWQQANPLCIALGKQPDDLQGLRIYFDAGTRDRYGFDAGNELLHEALEKQGIEHTFRLIEGGGHSWGSNFEDATLPYSFAEVGRAFRTAQARKRALDGLGGKRDGAGDGTSDGKAPTAPARPDRGGGR